MNPRKKLNVFFFKHRSWGIPNLMLYICLGSGIVAFTSMMNGADFVYSLLCFDKAQILQGQVWRLFTWLFTEQIGGSPLLTVLLLYFFYRLGRAVELSVGTLRFNVFYLSGVVLMDIFAMIFCPTEYVTIAGIPIPPELFTYLYSDMAYYLHLAMVLAYATLYPDSQFLILFIIPVKAWVLALIDLILIGISVFNGCYPIMFFPHCLFPLIGLLNYFIFFGSSMSNLLPLSWRVKLRRRRSQSPASRGAQPKVIPFNSRHGVEGAAKPPFNHRCTVCGRTDTSHPELEFRYCSRCSGYHCYCEDHISDHQHITE